MTLTIHIVPTGDSIETTGQAHASLDALRTWVAKQTNVKEADQILLTSKGKHVQAQTLLTEDVFYLYDRDLFTSTSGREHLPLDPVPEPWTPPDFPSDREPTTLPEWKSLFQQRREWASGILNTCRAMCTRAEEYLRKRKSIEDGIRAASSRHESYLNKLAVQQGEAQAWFEETMRTAGSEIQNWEEELSRLEAIPVIPGFGRFFGKQSTSRQKSDGANTGDTLGSFLDSSTTKTAAATVKTALDACESKLRDLTSSLTTLSMEYENLMQDVSSGPTRSIRDDPDEPGKQIQEIQAIVSRIKSDSERVHVMQPQKIADASKMASLHTRNFLPNLRDCAIEADDLLRYTIEQKNNLTQRALEHLQTVARIETAIPDLRKGFEGLELSEEGYAALDNFNIANNIPMAYGSLLLEAVKRKEWVDKMKHDSASLAEEIAGYQEEEHKRRRKWMRGIAHVIADTAVDGQVLGVEINLQGEDYSWPVVTREAFQDYLNALSAQPGMESVVESLTQTLRSMDQPTRQQVKRAKAFKMGSVHEAALGKASLLLRGDDEAKVLRETNLKLEEEAKGYKVRIKKLEDMYHRQSLSRLSVGGASLSTPFSDQPMTPTDVGVPHMQSSPRPQGDASRRSSISSRRVSFNNQGQDEKLLARRVVQLEADLVAAKAMQAKTEKTHLAVLDEANSTKNDLMENMEAQQREFSGERKLLEDELDKMKLRLEEMEDEFDRLIGSRDNEKIGADTRLQALMTERDDARREVSEKVRLIEKRSKSLERDIRERDEKDVERLDLLKGLHNILDPEATAPEDPSSLIEVLEALIQRSQDQAREVAQAVALARSENESLQATFDAQRAETQRLQSALEAKESDLMKAEEQSRTEQGKAASIASELENERQHLKEIREKFAEGETGSESLRRRLEEEQGKVSNLSMKLAETNSHVNSLDVELSSTQSKYRNLLASHEVGEKRLSERAQRAKTISQRLYASSDRLNRLLQALGFVVTFEDDKMKVERASRVGGASTVMSDGGASLTQQRSISSSSVPIRWLEDLSDVSLLLWMEKESPEEEEAEFVEYMDRISRFNLDTFSEAITKRMRDMEHTARKWQREARNWHEKARKYQSEGHDKIAFRSFKEGDLALFLPTRNQAMKPWAAFNVGAPHYFLREQDTHKLVNRDWLVARISKVEERTVDLSKTLNSTGADDGRSIGDISDAGASYEDDNPFDLSDGLRWYLLDASEEKAGAPTTPGLGKAVVSTSNVSATRDESKTPAIRIKKKQTDGVEEASKALSRSLDSRRSSHSSKKGVPIATGLGIAKSNSNEALSPDTAIGEGTSAHRNGRGPSHLRTTSDAASLRAGDDQAIDANLQDEHESTKATPAQSPQKFDRMSSMQKFVEQQTTTAAASPTKPPPMIGNGKPNSNGKAGVWDALFNLDISLQSGSKKYCCLTCK